MRLDKPQVTVTDFGIELYHPVANNVEFRILKKDGTIWQAWKNTSCPCVIPPPTLPCKAGWIVYEIVALDPTGVTANHAPQIEVVVWHDGKGGIFEKRPNRLLQLLKWCAQTKAGAFVQKFWIQLIVYSLAVLVFFWLTMILWRYFVPEGTETKAVVTSTATTKKVATYTAEDLASATAAAVREFVRTNATTPAPVVAPTPTTATTPAPTPIAAPATVAPTPTNTMSASLPALPADVQKPQLTNATVEVTVADGSGIKKMKMPKPSGGSNVVFSVTGNQGAVAFNGNATYYGGIGKTMPISEWTATTNMTLNPAVPYGETNVIEVALKAGQILQINMSNDATETKVGTYRWEVVPRDDMLGMFRATYVDSDGALREYNRGVGQQTRAARWKLQPWSDYGVLVLQVRKCPIP